MSLAITGLASAQFGEPPRRASRHELMVDARRALDAWRVAEDAASCASVASCIRRTVFLDGMALSPAEVEHALFQAWAFAGASSNEIYALRLDDAELWRRALATAVFLRELESEIAPVARESAIIDKARQLSEIQAREVAALSDADRQQMADMAPAGVAVTDPRSKEAVAGYAKYLARREVMRRLFGSSENGQDVAAARTWLRERLVARHAVVRGVDIAASADLASYLTLN